MPLPDKPRPRHRSPICGKLSSWTEEKGNSIGFSTSQKLTSPTPHPHHNAAHSYLTAPSRTQWKHAWGVASKDSFAQQRKRKLQGRHPKENCYIPRKESGAVPEWWLHVTLVHLSVIHVMHISCISFFFCRQNRPNLQHTRNNSTATQLTTSTYALCKQLVNLQARHLLRSVNMCIFISYRGHLC